MKIFLNIFFTVSLFCNICTAILFTRGYFTLASNPTVAQQDSVKSEIDTEKEIDAFDIYQYIVQAREYPIEYSACLSQQAENRALFLVKENQFDHTDKTGKENFTQFTAKCVDTDKFQFVSENLAFGVETAKDAHFGLMQSPPHRQNILSKQNTKIGVGCHKNVCVEFFTF